jgi:hypothetical protein
MVMEVLPSGDGDRALPGSDEAARRDALLHRAGSLACTEVRCGAETGIACGYVDRRSNRCKTAWCPSHRLVIGDDVYCRRHAGIVSALGAADPIPTTSFPDLDNRAPSLVAWVTRAIDGEIWKVLLDELGNESGGQLVADPVTLVFHGVERKRSWERAWKLVTHTGVARRVSVLVEETDDTAVVLKVGSRIVAREVPPWIAHWRRGENVPADEDARAREAFNHRLIAAIRVGVCDERVREREGWRS